MSLMVGLYQGSLTSGRVRNWAAQQEVNLNVMHSNHHETSPAPTWPLEKLSSRNLVPGAKRGGDHWLYYIYSAIVNFKVISSHGKK